jgi:hypothetical protein
MPSTDLVTTIAILVLLAAFASVVVLFSRSGGSTLRTVVSR